uniref:Uncharacterized protein n=1 Tax=Strigamia maritima TaxID=126957 RepID=T1JKT9_STRMM
MGRKIPKSTRHKKIKAVDPYYNGERKRLLYKNAEKFDVPPKDIDYQEVPKKLRDLMELREKMKNGTLEEEEKKKKKANKAKKKQADFKYKNEDFGDKQPGMNRPLKDVQKFKMKAGETDESFVARVGKSTQAVLEQSKLENKYDVDFIDDDMGGVEVQKRKSVDLEYEIRKKMRGVNVDKPKKTASEKSLKRKIKLREKKLRLKEANIDEFKLMKDDVAFGEVVNQPPNIKFYSTNPLKIDKKGKSLLLEKMMTSDDSTVSGKN